MQHIRQQNQPKNKLADPFEAQKYYECHYCGIFFVPRKRFIQKYCSESCRVMACRARKLGSESQLSDNVSDLSGSAIKTTGNHIKKQSPKTKSPDAFCELKSYLEKRDKELLRKVEKIQEKQTHHMWISALAPLLAEPLRKSLGRLFTGNKKAEDINQFLGQIAPKINDLPKELQVLVLNSAREYWDASLGNNNADKKKDDLGLPELNGAL